METVGEALFWRMRALVVAKRHREADPWITSLALADVISRTVEGAPARLDPIRERIRAWERTGAIPPRVKRAAAA